MKTKKPLTIDHVATCEKIKKDGRTVASWGRMREFNPSTVRRIFNGSYPYQEDSGSQYQKVLMALKRDGYLVEQDAQEAKAA
jgi:hypothetical protein